MNTLGIFLISLGTTALATMLLIYRRRWLIAVHEIKRLNRLLAQKTYIDPDNGSIHFSAPLPNRSVVVYQTQFGEGIIHHSE